MENLKKTLANNGYLIEPYCIAIYRGGSRVDSVIDNPHDYDYICFAKKLQRHNLLRKLTKLNISVYGSKKKIQKFFKEELSSIDFSQVRTYPYTQITGFSYLDILMQKVIGEDVCPKTDVIKEHRQEFFKCLYEKMNLLINGSIKNQKRGYHLLRGIYILINNSYEVSDEQKKEINTLHQLSEGGELIRDKTIELITNFVL